MPPRRSSRGRHRKPPSTSGPAYVTAAALAAFAVSGINVPGAIGAASTDLSTTGSSAGSDQGQVLSAARRSANAVAASALRQTLVTQQNNRATRLRETRAAAVKAVQAAAAAARKATEDARPKWRTPLASYRLTAGFGDYGLWSNAHTGQDFAAPQGTPILAAGDGVVIAAGYEGAYGNKVEIRHPDGTVTWYAHMLSIERSSGPVKAGDVIGHVGMTGNTTGPHVHFEVRPGGGDPVPPLTWLRQHGVTV